MTKDEQLKMHENIAISIIQLFEAAENNSDKCNLDTPIGEIIINKTKYQIQVNLIADERLFCKDTNAVRFSKLQTI